MRGLLLALQFLTRLPVPSSDGIADRDHGRSVIFYPAVGLLLGGMLCLLAYVIAASLPSNLAAALVLLVWVLVTGALHLDGLADSADAWAGGHGDRERTLAIMKDPRSGPVGVSALLLVLLLKYAAVQALFEKGDLVAVAAAPLLGRTVLPLLFLTTPYVRPGGLGEAMSRHLPRRATAIVCAASAALILTIYSTQGVAILSAAGISFLLLRRLMRKRIGGTTGDTAGALVEITETACLVAAVL